MTKPIEERKIHALLKLVGWKLKKGKIDYNLHDEYEHYICTVKIIHAKGKKREVSASSVRRIEHEFNIRGLPWPPQKKSKNI